MASLKEIKTRIASVKNTLKITSAMKLVASAKLHKAQMAIDGMMPYNERLTQIVSQLVQIEKDSVDGLTKPCGADSPSIRHLINLSIEPKRVALVTVSSSTSLCGGFNNNIIRFTQQVIHEYQERLGQGSVILLPIGRKVAQALQVDKAQGDKLTNSYNKALLSTIPDYIDLGEHPTYAQASVLAKHLTEMFLRGEVDCVELLYTHYKNMAVQEIRRERFLPIEMEERRVDKVQDLKEGDTSLFPFLPSSFILEPSLPELLDRLLPQALASRMYAMLLDSSAAEHAARTFAMQTATDNGDALLQELNILYNKSRQQAITNELLDIMGGQKR